LAFSVTDPCPDPPLPVPAEDLPYVDHVTTVPAPACPDRPVVVHFDGHLPGCGRFVSAGLEGSIRLVLQPFPDHPVACPAVLLPWSADVSIGQVIPGNHSVLVQETVHGTDGIWPPIPDAEHLGLFDFDVSEHCASGPNVLPYVSKIEIGPD